MTKCCNITVLKLRFEPGNEIMIKVTFFKFEQQGFMAEGVKTFLDQNNKQEKFHQFL